MVKLLSILKFALSLGFTAAECDLKNIANPGAPTQATDPALCRNQGEGSFTFGMSVGLTSLGIPGGKDGPPNPSVTGSTSFTIMDNACKILGMYEQPSCGVPYVIKENFLDYVLTIEHISADVGDPYFEFYYANGQYTTGNNHCVCGDGKAGFPTAEKDCRCAFPVAGGPTKREIAFQA